MPVLNNPEEALLLLALRYPYRTLFSSQFGNENTAGGYFALSSKISGSKNTAVGAHTLNGVTTGVGNTALGFSANVLNDQSKATAIGYNAAVNCTNCMALLRRKPKGEL